MVCSITSNFGGWTHYLLIRYRAMLREEGGKNIPFDFYKTAGNKEGGKLYMQYMI